MLFFRNRRPESESLVGSGFKDRKWLIQLSAAIVLVVLLISGYLYFTFQRPGIIIVQSNPTGAEVLIDRKATGFLTPAIIKGIVPGSYLLEVRKDSLIAEPAGAALKIDAGETITYDFRLFPPSALPPQKRTVLKAAKVDSSHSNEDLERSYVYPSREVVPLLPHERSRIPAIGGSGRIFVSSNVQGATIFLDGEQNAQLTDAWLLVPLGTHRVQVKKDGFSVDPPESSVLISSAFQEQRLNFQLHTQNVTTQRKVAVVTKPVEGMIYVDTKDHNLGRWEGNLSYGAHTIEFGDVTGYIKPPPLRIMVTQTDPSQEIEGVYKSGFATELRIGEDGKPIASNISRWVTGIHHPEVGGFKVDAEDGPPIVLVKNWNKYAWEFGFAYPNKNPVGGQFIQMEFNLPARKQSDPPMYLWLQTVRSTRNYPLTFLNRTIGVIEVNNHVVNPEWTPSRVWDTSDSEGWERHAISDRLVDGHNVIRIYSSDLNLRYFYISGIKVGPQPEEEPQ